MRYPGPHFTMVLLALQCGWQAEAPNATYFSQNLESGKNCGAGF
jgi:hypothetical protein